MGQDGSYLSKFLLDKGYEVHGLVRQKDGADDWRHKELDIVGRVQFHEGDLKDAESIEHILAEVQPNEIYNLAAHSFEGTSWDDPAKTAQLNGMSVLNMLNSIQSKCPQARFFQASSSEMFGNNHRDGIQDEDTPMHPHSPYSVSKLFAHWFTANYRQKFNLYACSGILFNHESPLRGVQFVTRKITDGVAKIKLGMEDSITLGYLDAKRDWGFAGDYTEAMWLMLQQDTPDDFVLSTGVNHSVRDFLDTAFAEIDITDWSGHVTFDEGLLRPKEIESVLGRNNKIQSALAWKPPMDFAPLVSMMVAADIARLSNKKPIVY